MVFPRDPPQKEYHQRMKDPRHDKWDCQDGLPRNGQGGARGVWLDRHLWQSQTGRVWELLKKSALTGTEISTTFHLNPPDVSVGLVFPVSPPESNRFWADPLTPG